jgi:hypothetical protein
VATTATTTADALATGRCSGALRRRRWTWRRNDEGGWWGRRTSVDLHLLQQEVSMGFSERRERPVHLEDGHHVAKLATEAAEEREYHLPIADGVAEFGKGGNHRLKAAAVVGDAQGLLAEGTELRLKEKSTRLLLSEEFILEVAPRVAGGTLPHHQRLLQVARDSAVDPREDAAVRLDPRRAGGERLILEDVAGEGILAKDGEEHAAPLGVGVCGLIEDDGDEGLDVDDGGGLRPEGLLRLLVLVQGSRTEARLLGPACRVGAGNNLGGLLVLGRLGGGGGDCVIVGHGAISGRAR